MRDTETDSDILRQIGKAPGRVSRDRLRVQIYEELRRADDTMDCDLIEENVRTLFLLDGQEAGPDADVSEVVRRVRAKASQPSRKRVWPRKLMKPALAACAVFIAVLSANMIMARATGNSLLDDVVEFGRDYIGFDFKNSPSVSGVTDTAGTAGASELYGSLRRQCEQVGMTVLLPTKYPAGFRQIQFQQQDMDDIGKIVSIVIGDKKDTVVISTQYYLDKAHIPSVKAPDATDLTRLNIKGLDVYLARQGSHYIAVFNDGNTVYSLSSSLGEKQTVDMLNSLS